MSKATASLLPGQFLSLAMCGLVGSVSIFAAVLLLSPECVAQESGAPPVAGTPAPPPTDSSKLLDIATNAKDQALIHLQLLGGTAATRAVALQELPPSEFFERIAVQPPVGPSTIAAPSDTNSVPFASVNWIVGNGGATAGDPGVALLLARRSGDDNYTIACSGTLINQNEILTAAHCICYSLSSEDNYSTGRMCLDGEPGIRPRSQLLDPENWRVFFQHVGVRRVSRVEINGQYAFSENGVRDDLAVLVLSKPVTEINPAQIPSAMDTALQWTSGNVYGFGYTAKPDSNYPGLLNAIVQPGLKAWGLVQQAPCKASYLDPNASLCSVVGKGPGTSGSTICEGDSGGPLLLASAGTDVGVTSGRNQEDCGAVGALSFQMSAAYKDHRNWISDEIQKYGTQTVKGQWPVFGENLLYVVDRRNFALFDDTGFYVSQGWVKLERTSLVLISINSTGPVEEFHVSDRDGNILCTGKAGVQNRTPNVDYCAANIPSGLQFRVVAHGIKSQYLQYVVSLHDAGTSFDEE